MINLIPFPLPLAPRLPTIEGNVDYLEYQHQLQRIDSLLVASGVETQFLELSLAHWQVWAVAETCGFGGCLKMLEVFGE